MGGDEDPELSRLEMILTTPTTITTCGTSDSSAQKSASPMVAMMSTTPSILTTCGTSDSLDRRSASPMVVMSTPSMRIRPPDGSTMRYSAMKSVLLPHPVRPHTPT